MLSSKYNLLSPLGGTDYIIAYGFYTLGLFLALAFSFYLIEHFRNMRTSQLHWSIIGITYPIATVTFYLTTTNIYGHQSEPIIRRDSCNYNFTSSPFIYHDISTIIINPLSFTSYKLVFI